MFKKLAFCATILASCATTKTEPARPVCSLIVSQFMAGKIVYTDMAIHPLIATAVMAQEVYDDRIQVLLVLAKGSTEELATSVAADHGIYLLGTCLLDDTETYVLLVPDFEKLYPRIEEI
jgi:hypothetical protein